VEVVSGQTVANELTSAVDNELSFISTALLIFAFISLFVGGFTIFNTFSITVGQRTRELALLRVVGASRGRIFRSVLGEAALTGLAASLIGLGLGVVAALGLKALLRAFGIVLPSSPLVFEARTPLVAIAVGVGVTVISAILPARRAVRIPVVAALVDHREDQAQSLRRGRVLAGSVVAAAGVLAVVAGVAGSAVGLVGLGALAVFVAAGMLVPLIARPLSGIPSKLESGRPSALAGGFKLLYLLLAFPSGRLSSSLDRGLIAATAVLLGLQLLAMLYGNKAGLRCPGCPDNLMQAFNNNTRAYNLCCSCAW
jgi:putative ABC transport system permease protein